MMFRSVYIMTLKIESLLLKIDSGITLKITRFFLKINQGGEDIGLKPGSPF